jgi:hypothetical protein
VISIAVVALRSIAAAEVKLILPDVVVVSARLLLSVVVVMPAEPDNVIRPVLLIPVVPDDDVLTLPAEVRPIFPDVAVIRLKLLDVAVAVMPAAPSIVIAPVLSIAVVPVAVKSKLTALILELPVEISVSVPAEVTSRLPDVVVVRLRFPLVLFTERIPSSCPVSERVTGESWIIAPEVPSKRTTALSATLPGPTIPPGATAGDQVPSAFRK